jgi:hypothetical protein
VASIFRATKAYRVAGIAACAGCAAAALLLPLGAGAQQQGNSVDVYQAPYITGTAEVGRTLQANGGAWRGPQGTQTSWQWWRCPTTSSEQGCQRIDNSSFHYTVAPADQGRYIFLVLWAQYQRDSDYAVSAPTAQVPAPPPPQPTATPTPAPTATATPVATPTPAPTFDVAAPQATPVPNLGAVLDASAKNRRVLRPFPVVRMRGRLTAQGAHVTMFSVRAPRHVRISVSCKGKGCPQPRWGRTASRRLTRIGAFERTLAHGMRITVVVSRRGYVGKRTVFWIRRGQAPLRLDSCVSAAGRRIACPAGAR